MYDRRRWTDITVSSLRTSRWSELLFVPESIEPEGDRTLRSLGSLDMVKYFKSLWFHHFCLIFSEIKCIFTLNIVGFFPRILKSLLPLPRQHSAAIGYKKKLPANRSDCTLALR